MTASVTGVGLSALPTGAETAGTGTLAGSAGGGVAGASGNWLRISRFGTGLLMHMEYTFLADRTNYICFVCFSLDEDFDCGPIGKVVF
jgi:hypothetical protein